MMMSGILTETLFIIPVYLFKKYPAFTANFVKIYDLDRVCKQYPYQGQCLWYYCHGIAILKVHPVHVINIEWCQVAATRCSCFDDGLFHLSASSVLKLIFGLSSDSLRYWSDLRITSLYCVHRPAVQGGWWSTRDGGYFQNRRGIPDERCRRWASLCCLIDRRNWCFHNVKSVTFAMLYQYLHGSRCLLFYCVYCIAT